METKATYRRAEWLEGGSYNLEQLLRNALQDRQEVRRRTKRNGDEVIECRHLNMEGDLLFLHLVKYMDGQETTVLPNMPEEKAPPIETAPPPENSNFMRGNIAAVISGNHVVLCGRNARDGMLRQFAAWLFSEDGNKEAGRFRFTPVADIDKVKLIVEGGVKTITFNKTIKAATLLYLERKHKGPGKLDAIMREFILHFTESGTPRRDGENLETKLVVNLNKRLAVGHEAEEAIKALGLTAVEDEGETSYVIQTQSGETIRSDELVVRKTLHIDSLGDTFHYGDAWKKLHAFLVELRETGALEQ